VRTQRPEKHMYQIDYMRVEICSQKTKSERILKELGFLQTKATIIYTNNQGCIALAINPVSHSHVLPDILLSWNDKIDIKCSLSNDITCQQ